MTRKFLNLWIEMYVTDVWCPVVRVTQPLPYLILLTLTFFHFTSITQYTTLHYTTLHHTTLHNSYLHTILSYTILYYPALSFTVLTVRSFRAVMLLTADEPTEALMSFLSKRAGVLARGIFEVRTYGRTDKTR